MAQRPFNAGDSANASQNQQGRTSRGFVLPGGTVFRDRGKLIQYLRKNPGFVYKHRGYLSSQLGDDFGLAGYHLSDDGSLSQYDGVPGRSTKLLRRWTTNQAEKALEKNPDRTQVIIVPGGKTKPPRTNMSPGLSKPGAPKPKPVPGTTRAAPGPTQQVPVPKGPGRTTTSAPGKGAPGSGMDPLLQIALQRLLGLNTNGGFQPLDPTKLLAGMGSSTAQQMAFLRSQMDDLDGQAKRNTGQIDQWFGQIGASVDRANERGQQMTRDLGGALAGNNAALLASIGGEAALGASPVGQVAANGQNTLAAMGAADAQFLNDMGPLLQAEGATLKASELARLAQMRKEFSAQMAQVGADDGTRRAELALQIAQMNNQGRQQGFQNAAGIAETLAGLAMSGIELDAKQQAALMDYAQRAQQMGMTQANKDRDFALDAAGLAARTADQQADAQAGQARSLDQKIARANRDIGKFISVEDYPMYRAGGLAPANLVKDVLNYYRSQGVDLSDPRARKAAAAVIKTFGVEVDPKWLRGWR